VGKPFGSSTRVRDLMTRDVRTLGRNEVLTLADGVMSQEQVRHLVVVDEDEGSVVGVLSQRDLFRGALARALGYGEHAQEKLMAQLRVKDVMTPEPVTIGPDAPAREAAQQMTERRIGCLPVVDGGRLVGILSESDFMRLWLGAG
jgi:CBS domain-containing protein